MSNSKPPRSRSDGPSPLARALLDKIKTGAVHLEDVRPQVDEEGVLHSAAVPLDRRDWRKLKREIKRAGNKRRRRLLKHDLAEHPEDAPFAEFGYGRFRSELLNGLDHDHTRRRRARLSSGGSEGIEAAERADDGDRFQAGAAQI